MAQEKQNTEQLRAQAALLLSQARSEAVDIRRMLSAVNGDSALQARLAAAAAEISQVASELSQALGSHVFPLRSVDLMSLRSVVDSGNLLVTEAAQVATSAAMTQAVTTTAADTRCEVQSLRHDLFEQHIYDAYLHFDSPADEAAFRRRTEETQHYMDQQLARGTPEGDLNAAGAAQEHMLDLGSHGATASPQYLPRWNKLAETVDRQRTAMIAAGQSTKEYDDRAETNVRAYLRARNLTDAEIERRLADAANPYDAATPFLGPKPGGNTLTADVSHPDQFASSDSLSLVGATNGAATRDAHVSVNFDAMAERLKAAGFNVNGNTAGADTGHGLAIQKPAAKGGPDVSSH